jgi:glycolate oxidase FAD binding subunit
MTPIATDAALQPLLDRVETARATGTPLRIRGGGTKDFYGETPAGEILDIRPLHGVSSYEPTELVVSVRAGTPLAELEALLATHGQCLPFDPPHFGPPNQAPAERGATVGGMIAAGLAGPARAAVGSVRDYVLGATLLNGKGEVLTFGGQVMKNVAGYDVSRLLAGSMGTLGVILEASIKVLPAAATTETLRFEFDEPTALTRLNEWAGMPLPLNASAWWDGSLIVRLRGADAAVHAARARLGGEVVEPELAGPFWAGVRDQHDEFFAKAQAAVDAGAALWRLSLPSTTPPIKLSGELLIEWGGAQRWLCTTTPAAAIREAAARAGGHATLFRGRDKRAGAFAPLTPPIGRFHRELKKAFDPAGVFNPGRLYPGI